jgi:hypothetical protein
MTDKEYLTYISTKPCRHLKRFRTKNPQFPRSVMMLAKMVGILHCKLDNKMELVLQMKKQDIATSTVECSCCHQVVGVSQAVLQNGQELVRNAEEAKNESRSQQDAK